MIPIISKIFAVLLAGIAISKSYVGVRTRAESFQVFIFWTLTWVAIVIVALFPALVDLVIASFGEKRVGLGTVFGMALVFLYFLVYRIYMRLDHMEQQLVKIVQELSLRDWKRTE
ncbi:MAG: hypothetical protein DMG12_14615 [Acidobacteria bacterium]|nr:MAG: hypothetical protein DMG12_14615 [Acidobacteriota bacterium]